MGAEPAVALRMMNQADREAEARRVLDVGPDASQDEVCAAFKQAALRAHPAENPEDTKAATLMYRRVRAAYLSLKEGASAEEIPSTNWRPSLTDMDPDSENDSKGHEHQVLPAFEPKLDQRSRRSRTVSAIEKKLNRTQSMNLLFQFGGTPAGGDKPSKAWASEGDRSRREDAVLERPLARLPRRASLLGKQRFDFDPDPSPQCSDPGHGVRPDGE